MNASVLSPITTCLNKRLVLMVTRWQVGPISSTSPTSSHTQPHTSSEKYDFPVSITIFKSLQPAVGGAVGDTVGGEVV